MTSASVAHTPSREIPEAVPHIHLRDRSGLTFAASWYNGSVHVLYDWISDDAVGFL